MKTIYLDTEFKCHLANDGTMTAVETDVFDDKCDAYIEGYRYVPAGATWTRSDGAIFTGEMIAPFKTWEDLDAAQRVYEREQYQSLLTENAELIEAMANMVDDVYNQDLTQMEE